MSDADKLDLAHRIGGRVRALRRQASLSQEQLAAKAGLTMQQVSKIETGNLARLGTLAKIADALAVDLGELVRRRHPTLTEEEDALVEAWRRMPPGARRRLLQLLDELEG